MVAATPKQRMLNAYRGVVSDRRPVAPEFWYYVPARVLGLDMTAFEIEVPLWEALQKTFRHYGTEGWGCVGAAVHTPGMETRVVDERQADGRLRRAYTNTVAGKSFTGRRMYDAAEPSWAVEYPVKDLVDLPLLFDACYPEPNAVDWKPATAAHARVGEDYLLELVLWGPFFDALAALVGFEKAIGYFMDEDPARLRRLQAQFTERQVALARLACENTAFESFFIGCSYSCNSLLGPNLWREWDKPVIAAVAAELHRRNRLLHIHFHGRSLETVADFVEMGVDCVCPFERPPGGDIAGRSGLESVRDTLAGQVTFNGNVHTVDTLIRGTAEEVRAEVREIKEVFTGEPRLIIGTGDQVGYETPDENIEAMIQEAKLA